MKRTASISQISKWKKAFSEKKMESTGNELLHPRSKQKDTSLIVFKKQSVTFQISRLENPDDFEQMSFVLKACAKASKKPFTTVLHVEETRTGSRLVATDGLRLHVAEISKKVKSGDYKFKATKDFIILGKPLKGIKFPEWEKAIPKNATKSGIVSLEKTGRGNPVEKAAELSLIANSMSGKTGLVVNMRYIAELPKTTWTVYKEPGFGKVVVRQQGNENRSFAVFVPIGKAA
jgi:hypothetical protein